MKVQDHTAPPCGCPECVQAGVSDRMQVRDPHSGKMLHGYELKRFYERADEAMESIRKLIRSKSMP